MKIRFNPCFPILAISAAAFIAASTSAHATDYNFGTASGPFTITASDQARALGDNLANFNDNGFGSVFDRGSNQDATYMHFNLSSLAGATINGTVSLNLNVDAQFGGAINSGVVGSASSTWSYPGSTPGIAPISGADPSGNYSTGQTATAVIDNTTFQAFVTNPSTFHGLAITAGDGSQAHFSAAATLTGNATSAAVKVTGGTDWSAALWNGDTSTLSISGASDVSGGKVLVFSGVTLSVTDSATLGAGTFSGTIATLGTLSFGSSVNQTLGGNITGLGALTKSGAGTLTLSGTNSNFSGGVTINNGTLAVAANTFGTGPVVVNNGGTLNTFGGWVFGGGNPWVATNYVPSVTVNAGGTILINESINGISNLYLNGGSVTGGGGYPGYLEGMGALFLFNGNEQITAGGATTSTISARIGLDDGGNAYATNTITVEDGSTLNITGVLANSTAWYNKGGFIKAGDGTLNLSAANSYTGNTVVNGGSLVLADNAQLKFVVTDAPATNMVTGSGTATIHGDFTIDTTGVSGATGHIWLLVDLGNLDPASSFTSTFSVIGFTPQLDGVTWTKTDAKGTWTFDESTGELTLDVGNDYQAWKNVTGVTGGDNDDDDHDGLTNHEEYAFGLDPTGGSSVNPITVPFNKTTGKFSYTRRNTALPDPALIYTVWYSTNLATWTQDTGATQGAPSLVGDVETVEVTLTPALLTNPKLFIQVLAN